jgi:hypothetical protein
MRSPARHGSHDQAAQAAAVRTVTGGTQDGDDLLHRGRIGRVAQPSRLRYVPRWSRAACPVSEGTSGSSAGVRGLDLRLVAPLV